MDDDDDELGPAGPVVFLRVEHHDGTPVAAFATDDGASFTLAEASLRRRIALLQHADEESREERQGLCALEASAGAA